MKRNIIFALFLSLIVVACSPAKPTLPPDFVIVHPDPTPELNLKEVDWQVWNQRKMVEEGAKSSNKDKVVFVLEPEEADKLFKNLVDISDSYAKSTHSNQYYHNAIEEYLKNKKAQEAESAKGKK